MRGESAGAEAPSSQGSHVFDGPTIREYGIRVAKDSLPPRSCLHAPAARSSVRRPERLRRDEPDLRVLQSSQGLLPGIEDRRERIVALARP